MRYASVMAHCFITFLSFLHFVEFSQKQKLKKIVTAKHVHLQLHKETLFRLAYFLVISPNATKYTN